MKQLFYLSFIAFGLYFVSCEQDPYDNNNDNTQTISITSADALSQIGRSSDYPLNGSYTLTEDITLSGDWMPPVSGGDFTGTFDGNGHTITYNDSRGGLFANTNGAVIRNLKTAGTITAESGAGEGIAAGSIAAGVKHTIIENCSSSVNITITAHGYSSRAGSIAGSIEQNSTIRNCKATGSVTLTNDAQGAITLGGGITGHNGDLIPGSTTPSGCLITNSGYSGMVSVTGNYAYAGGIAGNNYNCARISGCYSGGTVTATGTGLPYAGGVAGYNSACTDEDTVSLIENCYSNANVNAVSASKAALGGGIAGANAKGAKISKCYAAGTTSVTVKGDGAAPVGIGVPASANCGGIAGAQYYQEQNILPAIVSCVSLSAAINGADTGSGAVWNIFRIAGTGDAGVFSSNFANSAMSSNHAAFAADDGNGNNGADCEAKPAQSLYEGLDWDFTSVWKMGADGYPHLQWEQ